MKGHQVFVQLLQLVTLIYLHNLLLMIFRLDVVDLEVTNKEYHAFLVHLDHFFVRRSPHENSVDGLVIQEVLWDSGNFVLSDHIFHHFGFNRECRNRM